MKSNEERKGPFWDLVAGRVVAPPAAQTLGWQLEEIDPDAGTAQIRFDARVEFTNPVGAVQGGFLAAMLDDTMGPALVATLEPAEFAPPLS
jgi:acyl-coenzyme A thioesterase PaaI-like protein